MKESKIIIYISLIFLTILFPIMIFLYILNCEIVASIVSNIICGFIVSLITGVVQYSVNKNRIKYEIYGLYYDIYSSYYCTLKRPILFHYNAYDFYKKITDNGVKISSLLQEYNGFFRKQDGLYKKMNPLFYEKKFGKKIIKSMWIWTNKKEFRNTTEAYIRCVEKILRSIDENKFEKDFENSKKLYKELF